jgi:hypothetical protein
LARKLSSSLSLGDAPAASARSSCRDLSFVRSRVRREGFDSVDGFEAIEDRQLGAEVAEGISTPFQARLG